MLTRTFLVLAAVAAVSSPVGAASVQTPMFSPGTPVHTMADRWVDAWVVTEAGTWSECNGIYTDNLVSDGHVTSRGHHAVPAGTPAHVDAAAVSDSHLTLSLTMSQRLMVTREYRDYTLRAAARCQVDLKVLLHPGMLKNDDILGADALVQPVLSRFPNESAALAAVGFESGDPANAAAARETALAQQRELDNRRNAEAKDARVSQWISQTSRIPGQISNDPDYLAGFARGVEAGKATPAAQCADLVGSEAAMKPGSPVSNATYAAKGSRQKAWARGYEDGMRLALGLEALSVLPQCAPVSSAAPGTSGR